MTVKAYIRAALGMLILLLSSSLSANPSPSDETGVVEINLLAIDYFEAEIELKFNFAENIPSAYLGYDIPEVSRGYAPLSIKRGMNQIRLFVHRDIRKLSPIETSGIEITAYKSGNTLFKKVVPLTIHWPGPDYASRIMGGEVVKARDFTGVESVRVNRNLVYCEAFIKRLLLNGFPIEKISIFRPRDKVAHNNNIVLSKFLNPDSSLEMLRIFAQSANPSPLVYFDDSGNSKSSGEVMVGSGQFIPKTNKISYEVFNKLKRPDLTAKEMVQLIGVKMPDKAQVSMNMYEQARDLIDSGRKDNLQRAKAILDTLINSNPDFHQAYVELARYHMRTNWPQGLVKAEKLILMARGIEPDSADTHVLLGYVYTQTQRYKEAHKEYQIAERIGTDNLWLYANWGLNYEKQSLRRNAIDKYLIAIKSPKHTRDTRRPKSWIYSQSKLFDFLVEEKEYKKADALMSRSAEEFHDNKCDLQRQAELRAFLMEWYDGAIESYLKSKKSGCQTVSPVLAVAYYMKWQDGKSKGESEHEVSLNLRRAEVAAPSDAILYYGLAKGEKTSELIPEMAKLGKNINYVSSDGTSALLQAVKEKNLKAARNLLENGADVNIRSINDYYRPIVYATYLKDVDMINLLLEFKAETYIELEDGKYLDDFARSLGMVDVAEIFRAKINS